MLSAEERSSCFISENWIWEGSFLRLAEWIVSPSKVLTESVLSSEPSASKLSELHAPETIFFVCLPNIGILRPALWL